ncbi:hypothetical protein V5H41_28465, partial [Salmonella enterica]
SRELFIVPVWRRSWWQGAFSVVRWYLFLEKKPGSDIGHNPVAQAAMFGYFARAVYRPGLASQLVARRFLRGPLVSVSGEKTG